MIDFIYKNSPTVIRTIFLNAYAYFLNFERYGKKYFSLAEEFKLNESLSYSELEEYQDIKIKSLIIHAYEHVPYYNDIMRKLKLRPQDIERVKDLRKLPILSRQDIKNNFKRLQADNIPKYKIRHGHTSGTTGSPLNFLWDIQVCVAHHVADWRQKRWSGFDFGEPFASLQGRQIIPKQCHTPPFWIYNHVHKQLFLSSFHLKNEVLGSYVDKIRAYAPKAIEGYPSSIYVFAKYLEKINEFLPLAAILTSSETLLPIQRELIEKRFRCKVFDFYGMAERVVYGSECQYHIGKHLNMDYGVTEIVDSSDEVLPLGEFGTIVATSLWNYAMPLIRYKTSDATAITMSNCPCGCSFPFMDDVTTKSEDIVVLKDGRLVPSSVLTHPFKPINSILKSQIIQDSVEHIYVNIVKEKEFNDRDLRILDDGLRERLGRNIIIEYKFLDDIPLSDNGKYRWVISKVDLP